jgi:tetratricopeptide (TPR) repeat protein
LSIKTALTLNPDDLSTLICIAPNELAECPDETLQQGILELADQAVTRVKDTPHQSSALILRSRLRTALDDVSGAAADIEAARKIYSSIHPSTDQWLHLANALAELGRWQLEHGEFEAAESLLRKCVELRQQHAPDMWFCFNALSMLGGSLLGQKKYEDAEPLLVEGYEGLRRRQSQIPESGSQRLPEARQRLLDLYQATNRPDDAKSLHGQ